MFLPNLSSVWTIVSLSPRITLYLLLPVVSSFYFFCIMFLCSGFFTTLVHLVYIYITAQQLEESIIFGWISPDFYLCVTTDHDYSLKKQDPASLENFVVKSRQIEMSSMN